MRCLPRCAAWVCWAAGCAAHEVPETIEPQVTVVDTGTAPVDGGASGSSQPPTAFCVVPGRSGSNDLAMFDTLTERRWGDPSDRSPDPNFPNGYALDLRADGTYRWTSHGSTGDRADSGMWDFRASSATSGLLLLDGRSAIPFAIEDDGLCLLADSPYPLRPGTPREPAEGRRRDLPELGPPASWCLVTAEPYAPRTPWLDRPERVTIDTLGAATVQVDGESIDGVVSMYASGEDGLRLSQGWQVGPLRCVHPRRPEPVVHTYDSTPEGGGEWLFNHRFDPERSNPVQDLPDVRHEGVELRGRLIGKLFRGGSVRLGAAVASSTSHEVEGVYVTAQALKGPALDRVGPVVTAWHQEGGTYHLNPYAWLGFRMAMRLPDADGLEFTLFVNDEPWWNESLRLGTP